MGYLIDTSALVDLERRGQSLLDALGDMPPGDLFIPAIALAELWIAVELSLDERQRARRREKVERVTSLAAIRPFDGEVAPTYARLYAALRRGGAMIPENDLAVAATALHEGHDLVVGASDEKHFRRVPDLRLIVIGGESGPVAARNPV
jgi:predicted nucleic acid-binding protein